MTLHVTTVLENAMYGAKSLLTNVLIISLEFKLIFVKHTSVSNSQAEANQKNANATVNTARNITSGNLKKVSY